MSVQENMTLLQTAYKGFCWMILFILAFVLIICLIRAVTGPRVADRIVAINMMGTMVMVIIAIMSFLLKESYLVDICLIYAMASFLAVVVLTKVYLGIYEEKRHNKAEISKTEDNGK
ncbi:MAG: sodium:proton antiporter [Lachnospiraceae bacterium]|nr:sodium:proton antiporter [Lachnospiraceae bacterium]